METVEDTVFLWRLNELTRAGFTVAQAERLAASKCDLHEAIRLIERGASAEQAFDILS